MKLDLDSRLRSKDGVKVRLADVVIEPRTRRVTHVIVTPDRPYYETRLVPIADVDDTDQHHLRLRCTDAQLDDYPMATENGFLELGKFPVAAPGWAVGIEDVLALPHFDAEFGDGWFDDHYTVGWDRIPAGEIEIRRDSIVNSAEGREVGTVDGFVCDNDGHVTHLVLQHGHVLGRRDIAIPIGRVQRLQNGRAKVDMTIAELDDLPGVTVHRWHHPRPGDPTDPS